MRTDGDAASRTPTRQRAAFPGCRAESLYVSRPCVKADATRELRNGASRAAVKPRALLRYLAAFLLAGLVTSSGGSAAERPNIAVIFVDDLGYGDLGCYGNDAVTTPNIDRLASEGIRFTQFYTASPICSPSRVALMTGQCPQRWRVFGHFASRKRNRERGMADWLDPDAVVLPRLLHRAGYATGHFGKWHMGGGRDVGDAPLPAAYGFDESLVSFEGLGDRLLNEDHGLSRQSAELGRGEIRRVRKHEKTRIYVDRAIDFIRRNETGPFYVHLWPNDVHDPFQPSEAQVSDVGQPPDRPNPEQWQQFFAVLRAMDAEIGRFVHAIDEMGLGRETLVVLTSDNGPTAWSRYYRGNKGHGAAPGFTAGLRGRKWSLYEGGIRMPLIVRWSGRVPGDRVNDTTVACTLDLLPSLAAIAGAELPEGYRSDGVDFSRELLGEAETVRARPIFWEYNSLGGNIRPGLAIDRSPVLAVRDGDWKLLAAPDGSAAELYNLAADPDESDDLAPRYPRRTDRLRAAVVNWYRGLDQASEHVRESGGGRNAAPAKRN